MCSLVYFLTMVLMLTTHLSPVLLPIHPKCLSRILLISYIKFGIKSTTISGHSNYSFIILFGLVSYRVPTVPILLRFLLWWLWHGLLVQECFEIFEILFLIIGLVLGFSQKPHKALKGELTGLLPVWATGSGRAVSAGRHHHQTDLRWGKHAHNSLTNQSSVADPLVLIRIRGSVLLTNGSGSESWLTSRRSCLPAWIQEAQKHTDPDP